MMHTVISILNVVFLLLVLVWVWRKQEQTWRKIYWLACAIKLMAGIGLGIIYSSYYETSDTFIFFNLAAEKATLARTDIAAYFDFIVTPGEGYFLGEHRTIFFIKLTSFFALLTDNNYWIISLYYSAISFFAAWYLTKTIVRLFPVYRAAACIAFLFFPGVVFWSSGLIKESLAIAALFFLTAVFIKYWMCQRISVGAIILSLFAVWLIFNLKYYYLAVFIPVCLSVLWMRWISSVIKAEKFILQLAVWLGLLACGFALITFLHPNFSPGKLLNVIVSNNALFMEVCTADDVIHFYNLAPTWPSMLINSPWAFVSGLFRPFVWEANNIFKLITAFQNLMLLVLTVMSLPFICRLKTSPHRFLILSAVLYSVVLGIFLALSTPNFGTLTRYNVGYLPFVVLLVMQQPFVNKLFSKVL